MPTEAGQARVGQPPLGGGLVAGAMVFCKSPACSAGSGNSALLDKARKCNFPAARGWGRGAPSSSCIYAADSLEDGEVPSGTTNIAKILAMPLTPTIDYASLLLGIG